MYKRNISIIIVIVLLLTILPIKSNAQVENKNDCDKVKFALIASLMPTIDQALGEIYKDIPGGERQWAGYETEILNIEQLYGIGGAYRVKLRVHTYVGAHNPPFGEDTITIEVGAEGQKIIKFEHNIF